MNHVLVTVKPLTYVAVDQSGAGTTQLAAAVAGKKHKVMSVLLVASGDATVKFTGSSDLTGAMAWAERGGAVLPSGFNAWCETGAGEALSLVTTGAAVKGVVGILTE